MHRKQSLFGPLLLILLGTLLLVRNFRPEFPFWELVAQYWPVVLLVWGLAKLAEALRRPATEAGAWRPSLTVGEFFLALLLVLVGISSSKWKEMHDKGYFAGIDVPWASTYTYSQSARLALEPKSSIRIENPYGDVRVIGADGAPGAAAEVSVVASKRIRTSMEKDAESLNARTAPEIVRDANGYTVRISSGHPQMRADMEVIVPKATPLRLEIRRGSVDASNLEGDFSAEVDRGDIAVNGITGNVRLQIRRGSLTARNINGNVEVDGRGSDIQVADVTGQLLVRGEYSGASEYSRIAQGVKFSSSRTEMEIQRLPGKVDMTIGSLAITEPGGMVSVHTRNKDIRIEDFAEKVQIINRGATVELRTTRLPLRDIEVENHSGTIELAVPEKSEFQIEANARRGEVDSEFSIEMMREGENGWIKGKVGGAGATIKLNTSYGAIRLKKAVVVVEERPASKAGNPPGSPASDAPRGDPPPMLRPPKTPKPQNPDGRGAPRAKPVRVARRSGVL